MVQTLYYPSITIVLDLKMIQTGLKINFKGVTFVKSISPMDKKASNNITNNMLYCLSDDNHNKLSICFT